LDNLKRIFSQFFLHCFDLWSLGEFPLVIKPELMIKPIFGKERSLILSPKTDLFKANKLASTK
jgi:hypothetical protein